MPKQIRTRSAVKKKGAVEFRGLPFEEWLKRFDLLLTVGSAAHQGLRRWIAEEEKVAKASKAPWRDDCRLYVLEDLHDLTSPSPLLAEHARRANEHAKDSLKEFVQRIDSLTGHVGRYGTFSAQLGLPIDASELVKLLDSAAKEGRKILALIDRKHTRQPKIIDQCLPLLLNMSASRMVLLLTEKQVCALARLAMRAHGYDDNELADLHETRRTGTPRKHAGAYRRRALAITGMAGEPSLLQEAFLFRLFMALKYHLSIAPAAE